MTQNIDASKAKPVSTAVTYVLCAGLYALLAGTVTPSEIGTTLAVAIFGTVWSVGVQRNSSNSFAGSRELVGVVSQLPRLLVTGTFRTAVALLKVTVRGGSPGGALEAEFQHGAEGDARDRGRRALALLAASVAPDSFVVRLDRGRAALLHCIVKTHSKRDPRKLI